MSYRETTSYWGHPPSRALSQHSDLGKILYFEGLDGHPMLPRVWVSVEDVGAVLWDPEERPDEEDFHTYLLIVDGQERTIFSRLGAAQLLIDLFDTNDKQRNWHERKPTDRRVCRTDFATHPAWRCHRRLPTTGITQCAIALVPAHVTTVMAQQTRNEGAFFVRHLTEPLLLTDLHMPALDTTAWLFDASHCPDQVK